MYCQAKAEKRCAKPRITFSGVGTLTLRDGGGAFRRGRGLLRAGAGPGARSLGALSLHVQGRGLQELVLSFAGEELTCSGRLQAKLVILVKAHEERLATQGMHAVFRWDVSHVCSDGNICGSQMPHFEVTGRTGLILFFAS